MKNNEKLTYNIPNNFIELIDSYYKNIQNNPNHRFRSWEYCYMTFCKARNKECVDYDKLCLNLAFYLASWGMYRGSSFLLQCDYKVHMEIVKEILKPKYDSLCNIKCSKVYENINLIKELSTRVKEMYKNVRNKVYKYEIRNDISDTLCTKVLLGTLGCVPAYDQYFVKGIRKYKLSSMDITNSLIKLARLYIENEEELELCRKKMKIGNELYPQMKLLDMGFWCIGNNI